VYGYDSRLLTPPLPRGHRVRGRWAPTGRSAQSSWQIRTPGADLFRCCRSTGAIAPAKFRWHSPCPIDKAPRRIGQDGAKHASRQITQVSRGNGAAKEPCILKRKSTPRSRFGVGDRGYGTPTCLMPWTRSRWTRAGSWWSLCASGLHRCRAHWVSRSLAAPRFEDRLNSQIVSTANR
jgi:hypothetical protein